MAAETPTTGRLSYSASLKAQAIEQVDAAVDRMKAAAREPSGTLQVTDTMILQRQHAIYVDVIFTDEDGRR